MKKLAALLVMAVCPLLSHAGEIAHWNFDEASGSIAHDSIGSVNGTLTGSAAFVPGGIFGNAISLANATNDLVNMGNNFSFPSGSFSVIAWIKTTSTTSAIPVAKHEAFTQNGYIMGVNDIGDGIGGAANSHVHFYEGVGGQSGVSPAVVNDGQWHQLVGVYDASNNSDSIFVDGALQSVGAGSGMLTSGAPFLVGGVNFSGVATNLYTGLVDEVSLYDSALTAPEVATAFSSVPEPAIVASIIPAVLMLRRSRRIS